LFRKIKRKYSLINLKSIIKNIGLMERKLRKNLKSLGILILIFKEKHEWLVFKNNRK
jgi:hypothetical protein